MTSGSRRSPTRAFPWTAKSSRGIPPMAYCNRPDCRNTFEYTTLMQLKHYQQDSLARLKTYLETARLHGSAESCQRVQIARMGGPHFPPFQPLEGLECVPYVCLRLILPIMPASWSPRLPVCGWKIEGRRGTRCSGAGAASIGSGDKT